MPTTITGTDGISQVQAGAVESGDLPAGSVIQVVHAVSDAGGDLETTSGTFSDIPSLSVSITPQNDSSTVLIMFEVNVYIQASSGDWESAGLRLLRGSTVILSDELGNKFSNPFGVSYNSGNTDHEVMYSVSKNIEDSPQTTNNLTYKVQGSSLQGTADKIFNRYGSYARITAMEIAG